ncbi:MAG: nucleotidyltransferase family protein [Alphaproteobacteria bacterium]|nr:nucleotidyltransferase family protein [Alphaproteobacteria bacterium]
MPKAIPHTAMYLAAGLGERMRPLTNNRPKPLVQLAGRPQIDYALDRLRDAGVRQVVINLHYLGAMIRGHLQARGQPEIIYSDESTRLLGAGGGVVKALPLLGDQAFFVHNCDSFWRDDGGTMLRRMAEIWDDARMDALLLIAKLDNATGFGLPGDYFMEADGKLRRNREKSDAAPFAYCGVQIAHPRLFANAPQGEFSTVELWDRAEQAGRLAGIELDVHWFHTGTPEALAAAEQFLNSARQT